ncbi:MAG: hypothetical protein ACREA2_07655 [Blastocatellia bacterium]
MKFLEPMDGAVVWELEYAAHLAAHRIEILAEGGLRYFPSIELEEEAWNCSVTTAGLGMCVS